MPSSQRSGYTMSSSDLKLKNNIWVFCTTISLHILLLLRVGWHTWSSQGSRARGCQQLTEVFITQVGPAMTIILCGGWGTSYWATVYTRPRLFLVGSLPRHGGLKWGLDSWCLLEMISEWTNVATSHTPYPYSIPHLTRNPSHCTNTTVGLVRPDLLDFSYSCIFFVLPSGHRRTVPLLQGPGHNNNEHLTMQWDYLYGEVKPLVAIWVLLDDQMCHIDWTSDLARPKQPKPSRSGGLT